MDKHIETEEKVSLMGEVLMLAYKVNAEKRTTVFVEYMGHVDKLGMRVFFDGWRSCADPDKIIETCPIHIDVLRDMLHLLQGISDDQMPALKVAECALCRRDIINGDSLIEVRGKTICADCANELKEVPYDPKRILPQAQNDT